MPTETPSNPYVGPRSFQREQKNLFFGRDLESRDLISLVRSERLVLFYAQSGAGKTSLINARLAPRLEEEGFLVLPTGRVRGPASGLPNAPLGPTENVFIFNLLNHLNENTKNVLARPPITPSTPLTAYLAEYLRSHAGVNDFDPATSQRLLVIDQFEELITTYPEAWDRQKGFFEQLRDALKADPLLWVVLSLREDYLAPIDVYSYLMPGQMKARFYMQRLGTEAAVLAVRRPVETPPFNRPYEPGVAEELVRQLRSIHVEGESEARALQFVETMQLQVVCYQLWKSISAKPGPTITMSDLVMAGDVDKALADYYQSSIIDQVVAATGFSELHLRYWIDDNLYSITGHRRIVDQARAAEIPPAGIQVMLDEHFINAGQRDNINWYELSHDRLVRPVQMANQTWWSGQNRLVQAAKAWLDSGKSERMLLLDPALEQLAEKFKMSQLEDPLVGEFIQAVGKQLKRDLASTGWGVIFPENCDPALREALSELLQHRRGLATSRSPAFYHEFCYRKNETGLDFLRRQNALDVELSPERVPYYLLIVGEPDEIPYPFQYQLDINYAVGRIAFDRVEDYARYAHSVVEAESGSYALSRRATFFGVTHLGDSATQRALERLVRPVTNYLRSFDPTWMIDEYTQPETTTKAKLAELMGGPETPAFLFTTSNSMKFTKDAPQQLRHSGALVTSDWPGPKKWSAAPSKTEPFPQDFYFSGDDVPLDGNPFGLIAFLMTGRSAGTPRLDDFYRLRNKIEPDQQAPKDFMAWLPRRLLSHPNGGALAVIGHIDEAYNFSITGLEETSQPSVFRDTLTRLLNGRPVGSAMELFNQRYAMLSSLWFDQQSQVGQSAVRDSIRLEASLKDARNYVIIGDPAVRMLVGKEKMVSAPRPVLQPPAGMRTLRFHPAAVTAILQNPAGSSMLTTCADGALRLWDREQARLLWVFQPEGKLISGAAWSADGLRVAAVSQDATLYFLQASSAQVEDSFQAGQDPVSQIAWQSSAEDRVALPSEVLRRGAYLVRIWNRQTRAVDCVLRGHETPITSIAFHPLQTSILTASQDGNICLWSASGELQSTLRGHIGEVRDARFSPDGLWMVSAGQDGAAVIRDTATGQEFHRLAGSLPLRSARFSPDGKRMITVAEDGAARVWEIGEPQPRFICPALHAQITAAEFDNTQESLLTADTEGLLRRWTLPTRLPVPDQRVTLVGYSPDSSEVVTICDTGQTNLFRSATGAWVGALPTSLPGLNDMVFSSDGRLIAAAGEGRLVYVWNAQDRTLLHVLKGHTSAIKQLAFSPDGRTLLSAGPDKTIHVWDMPTGADRQVVTEGGFISYLRYSRDGRYLLARNNEGSVLIWQAGDTLTSPLSIAPMVPKGATLQPVYLKSANFHPSGDQVLLVGQDNSLRIWTTQDAQEVAMIPGGPASFQYAIFSRGGSQVLSVEKNAVRLWDWDGAQLKLAKFFTEFENDKRDTQAEAYVYGSLCNQDRTVLARGNCGIRLWNVADGELLLRIDWNDWQDAWVEVSPDGRQIAVISNQQTYLIPLQAGLVPVPADILELPAAPPVLE